MKIITDSGIKIQITNEDFSQNKLLIFEKPVKAIELTSNESNKIANALIRQKQMSITGEIRKLIFTGFFKTPRTFREIKNQLLKSIKVKSSSLNVILMKMIERAELDRSGKPRTYIYFKKGRE
jgi:hypothetical protein